MKLTPSTRAPAHTRLQPLHIITSTFPTRSRKRTIHSFASAAASLHKMDASLDRHFDNTLTDWVDGQPVTVPADLLRRAVADTVEQVVRARHSGDPFAYVGSSGVAYMLWHIATASGDPEAPGNVPTNNWLERGLRYTRAAAQDVQRYSKEQYGGSLLCGAVPWVVIVGVVIFGVVIFGVSFLEWSFLEWSFLGWSFLGWSCGWSMLPAVHNAACCPKHCPAHFPSLFPRTRVHTPRHHHHTACRRLRGVGHRRADGKHSRAASAQQGPQ